MVINRLLQAPLAKEMQLDANSESDGRNGDENKKGKEKEDIALLSITHDGGYICAMVLYTGVDGGMEGLGKWTG